MPASFLRRWHMIVKRIWQVVSGEPMHVIKEDEFTYSRPEDLEELLDPDGLFVRETPAGYKVIITSYYHASNTVIYFCIKGGNNEN